jgi:hypothetical protein
MRPPSTAHRPTKGEQVSRNAGLLAPTGSTSIGRAASRVPTARLPLAVLCALSLFASLAFAASASADSAEMGTVTEASYASAHVEGKVTTDEFDFNGSVYYFEYSTDQSTWTPGLSGVFFEAATSKKVEGPLSVPHGATKYFVRLKVVRGGNEVISPAPNPSFTTLPVDPPAVLSIDNPSDVAYTTATVKGEVSRPANPANPGPGVDPAFDVDCHFQYVTDAQFNANPPGEEFTGATSAPCEPANPVHTEGPSKVEAHLTGLANDTEYHLRLVASNASPTSASKVAASTFKTLKVAPPSVISTDNATAVEYTQARVKGVVERPAGSDPAFDVNCTFEYITDEQFNDNPPGEEFAGATPVACEPNPVTALDTAPGTTKAVEATLPGLSPSTTYHLRLSASNQGGSDAKEAAAIFTTQGPVPKPTVLAVDDATGIDKRTAQGSGEIERPAGADPALDTSCRFEYISDQQFDDNVANIGPEAGFEGAAQAFCNEAPPWAPLTSPDPGHPAVKAVVNAELSGLTPDTTYHLRLAAENLGGTDAKDAVSTFTTLSIVPSTLAVDSITEIGYTGFRVTGTENPGNQGVENPYFQYSLAGAEEWRPDFSTAAGLYPGVSASSPPKQLSVKFPCFHPNGVNCTAPLRPGTAYQVRLVGQEAETGSEILSPPLEFTTSGTSDPPSASCDPVTGVTGTTTHFSCTVDTHALAGPLPDEAKAAYKTNWHIECTPECKDANGNVIAGTVEAEEGSKAISIDAKRLDPNTHYEAKLIAADTLGTVETPIQTFNTPLIKPTVKAALGASDGKGGYTIQGTVNPNGSKVTDCKFEWGPNSADYAFSVPCSPMPVGRNEVQQISIVATEGQFRLSYRGQTTLDIAAGAAAAVVESELEALTSIGPNLTVTGGPNPGPSPYLIAFDGSLGEKNLSQIQADGIGLGGLGSETGLSFSTKVDGGGSIFTTVEAHLTGLNPGVAYHFNLLATNGAGEAESGDQEFTPTLAAAKSCPENEQERKENNSLALPECRAYEMVTPPSKEGYYAIFSDYSDSGFDRVHYVTGAGNIAKSGQSGLSNDYVTARTATGWETIPNLNGPSGSLYEAPSEFQLITRTSAYSEDLLSTIWAIPRRVGPPGENTYLRNPDGTFTLIGDQLGTPSKGLALSNFLMGASADLSHLVFTPVSLGSGNDRETPWGPGVYEYVGTGNSAPRRIDLDNFNLPASSCGKMNNDIPVGTALGHAISADGSTIVFTARGTLNAAPDTCVVGDPPADELWARVNGTVSFDVSASQCNRPLGDLHGACNAPSKPTFVALTPDGSRVFFTTTQQLVDDDIDQTNDLYACDIPTGDPAPIGEANSCASLREVSGASTGAEVDPPIYSSQGFFQSSPGVLSTSEDGSSAYFIAKGVLADNKGALEEQAIAGDHNLYVWRQDASHPDGQTSFVGRLLSNDVQAQATTDGHYLVLATATPLVATDTDTARDVYRYDAGTGEITRVSAGDSGIGGNAGGLDAAFSQPTEHHSHPAITGDGQKIVFTSAEALSAADAADGNGEPDVYLWTPGHVSLITTGSVGGGSFVIDGTTQVPPPTISDSGQDIYFQTPAALTPADGDDLGDVYDARTGGGFSFAQAAPCSGEACQSPVAPRPASESSETERSREGNPTQPKACPKGKVRKHGKCVKKPKRHSGKKHHGKKASHKQGGGK